MNRRYIQAFVVGVVLSAGTSAVHAVEFAGGTGVHGDPYQIATAEQFLAMGELDPEPADIDGLPNPIPIEERYFVLVSDIDLDPNLSENYVLHKPLVERLSGVFDGKGFRVRHLTFEGEDDLGLFRRIEEKGEVKNLILEDVRVSHLPSDQDFLRPSICALCVSNHGYISRCSVTGVLSGEGDVAGLVVWNSGTIEECRSVCTLSVVGYAGGLVDINKGVVQDCFASGRLSVQGCAGGLVGDGFDATVRRCYSTCQIDIDGQWSCVGGLMGTDFHYSASAGAKISNSYFLDPCDGGGPDNGFGTPLTGAQMKQQVSFVRWEFAESANNFSHPWYMAEDAMPELAWFALKAVPSLKGISIEDAEKALEEAGFQVGDVVHDYDHAIESGLVVTARPYPAAPAGTPVEIVVSTGRYEWSVSEDAAGDPCCYEITTAGQLDCLAFEPELWTSHFKLDSDLDLTGRVYHLPLLGGDEVVNLPPFDGTFDGNGHVIRNMTIDAHPWEFGTVSVFGLFGETGPSVRIENLGLAYANIQGSRTWSGIGGMLCGINRGYIGQCYSQGNLRWRGWLGGLVGSNRGAIANCYAEGSVKNMNTRDPFGGYAGLVADNARGGKIDTCYAACAVPFWVGRGLVANGEGSLENCLWDVDVTGPRYSKGGTGLSTEEMMSVQVLTDHGWGDNPYWVLNDGKDYPRLVWEKRPGASELGPGR